jgi:hypothetical protein
MITLEEVLNTVSQLPVEQQEMLIQIVQNRLRENCRQEIAEDAKQVISSFHKGELKPQTAEEVIAELRETVRDDQ